MLLYLPAGIKQYPLASYFVLAFVFTWGLISPLVLNALGLVAIPLSPHWHFLGGFGPALAALIATRLAYGRAGLAEFMARLRRWRIGRIWWLIALLSPLFLFVLAALILRLVGNPWPDFGKLATAKYASFSWIGGSLLAAVAYGIGEEVGWRGFALPSLQNRHSALGAAFILSLFWAVWHIPMFSYRFEFGVVQLIGFFIGLFAGAIWLSFLYNSTAGSVLMVAVWHAVWNIVNMLALVVASDVASLMSAMVMLAAIVVVLVWGPARLSMGDKHTLSHRAA